MKVRLQVILLVLVSVACGQEKKDLRFRGVAINTTNAKNPEATPIEITIINGECKLTVEPPLGGSGTCHLSTLDKQQKTIQIVSDGPQQSFGSE
jgi:hypothetical protein